MKIRYRTVIRPVGFGGLPHGVKWEYVEAPRSLTTRPDLPCSDYTYGVFTTDRPLTREELDRFDIAVCPD
jgi:hypothetical protein